MNIDRQREAESDAVRSALVADLAHSTVPTSIMGCTLVGIAIFAHASTGIDLLLVAAVCGGLASVAKVALMQLQIRRRKCDASDQSKIWYWEQAHAATTIVVAVSVGATAALIFLQPDLNLQMIATGLIFGYCSGVVSRIGIRPRIAITALILTAIPPIIAAARWEDASHLVIVAVFSVFLIGSFESVRHVHRTAVRHVSMRLEMANLARKDPLTGLANRIGLRTAFQGISPADSVAVLCLDLDGFKLINDRYGHAVGDALLKMVSERLVAATATDATIVRMGGDEFVVLQPGMHHKCDVEELARRLTARLHEPFILANDEVRIGASVGYAAVSSKPSDLDSLLIRADEASYRVKSTRRTERPIRRTGSVREGGA